MKQEGNSYKEFVDENYTNLKESFVKDNYPEFLDYCRREYMRKGDVNG